MPFFAKLKASLSPSPAPPSRSKPTSNPPARPQAARAQASASSTAASASALKRRNSFGASLSLFRSRTGGLDDVSGAGAGGGGAAPRTGAPASQSRPPSVAPRVDLPSLGLATPSSASSALPPSSSTTTTGPRLSALALDTDDADAEAQRRLVEEEDRVLAELRLTSDECAELVRGAGRQLKERGLGVPGLYLPEPATPFPTPATRSLLLAFLRLRRPSLLPPLSPPSDLALPQPSPAYLFELELNHLSSPHALATLVLFATRRLGPSPTRERWYVLFAELERAGGYPPWAWSELGKEGEEKRLLTALAEVVVDAAAWDRTTGVSLGSLARLVGYSVLRPSDPPSTPAAGGGAGGAVDDLVRDWEDKGQKAEHCALAFVRDLGRTVQLPTRLEPLIDGYPYPAPALPTSTSTSASAAASPGVSAHSHSRSSSALSLPLPLPGSSSSTAKARPPGSTNRTPLRALHVHVLPPAGEAGAVRQGARVDPLRLAGWALGTREADGGARGSLASEVWREVLTSVRTLSPASSSSSTADADGPSLDAVFAADSLAHATLIATVFPSAPPAPIVTRSKTPEPLYRPFPKSESSFLLREGLVPDARDHVDLGMPIGSAGPGPVGRHHRQRSKSHSDGVYLAPFDPSSSSTTNDTVPPPPSSSSPPRTPSSTWAAFSSFGFDSTPSALPSTSPASATAAPALTLGAGLGLDLAVLAPQPPAKRINARSEELERILQGFDDAAQSPVSPAADARALRPSEGEDRETAAEAEQRAELKSVSILKVDEAFVPFLSHAQLDPASLPPSFPTLALFRLSPALIAANPSSPEWVLFSLAPSTSIVRSTGTPIVVARLPAREERWKPVEGGKEKRRSSAGFAASLLSFSRKPSVKRPSVSAASTTSMTAAAAKAARGGQAQKGGGGVGEFGTVDVGSSSSSFVRRGRLGSTVEETDADDADDDVSFVGPSTTGPEAPPVLQLPKSASGWSSQASRSSVVDIGRPPPVAAFDESNASTAHAANGGWTPPVLPADMIPVSPPLPASATVDGLLAPASLPSVDGSALDRFRREAAPLPELPPSTLPETVDPSSSASPAPAEDAARARAIDDEPSLLADVVLASQRSSAPEWTPPDVSASAPAPSADGAGQDALTVPQAAVADALLSPPDAAAARTTSDVDADAEHPSASILDTLNAAVDAVLERAERAVDGVVDGAEKVVAQLEKLAVGDDDDDDDGKPDETTPTSSNGSTLSPTTAADKAPLVPSLPPAAASRPANGKDWGIPRDDSSALPLHLQ